MIQATFPQTSDYQTDLDPQYDAIIIGAGPAGSTVAALLAEQGHSVCVLERHTIPRFHVGESLIPETYWTLKRLGLIEKLKQSAFPKKFSVQFISDGFKESAPFYFDMHNPHESSQTWQVERAEFDKMLVDNAVEKGATVRTQAQVTEVIFDGDRAVGVKVKLKQADETSAVKTIQSKVVIDCSGTSSFLSNRLKLRQSDPLLQKATIWTYWKNAYRDPGKDEGATLIIQSEGKQSWFWYIPLQDNIVSVGCTGALSYMFPKGATAENTYQRELKRCPALQKRLENAERCMDYNTTKDYSYHSTEAAGNGWVLCGDAFSFIDPVYSSGVYLALKGGEFVADAVHTGLRNNDFSAQTLGSWKDEYRAGIANFRKLVYAFYAPGFSFGKFMKANPDCRRHLVDILIGAVFKPGVEEIFDVMGDIKPASEVVAVS